MHLHGNFSHVYRNNHSNMVKTEKRPI